MVRKSRAALVGGSVMATMKTLTKVTEAGAALTMVRGLSVR